MNLSRFFDHWRLRENPFRGEEARHDEVFARMSGGNDGGTLNQHSDFEKIVGDLGRCSTSVVFGEKGSGKTAIRLQLAARVRAYNEAHPDERVLLLAYDELNGFLDRLYARAGGGSKAPDVGKVLQQIRLVDHVDAILSLGVGRVVNGLLGGRSEPAPAVLPDDAWKRARNFDRPLKRDLLVLQAAYDEGDEDGRRGVALARRLRVGVSRSKLLWGVGLWIGWVPLAAALYWLLFRFEEQSGLWYTVAQGAVLGSMALYLTVLLRLFVWDRLARRRWGRRLEKQLRFLGRSSESYGKATGRLRGEERSSLVLPVTGSDEVRYAMLDRLRRVLAAFGYRGVLVVVDRVDEPTLVNGDAERMRSVIWPLFNNKFLQQERFGLKMLLPIELRYALFKESNSFFQEARLDKQSMIERLTWTGATLYDLCNARLEACLIEGAEGVGLLDLFEEDVTRQDLVDALDQMHQPRDAFKFLYRCLNEHCSNVTADQGAWRVPRLVLEQVRKQEAERVQQLERGIRPA